MKNLILFALLIQFSLLAQIRVEERKTTTADETEAWIVKISSDSEMRVRIMDMMVENTKESTDEMKKLADSISNNPELHKIIAEAYLEREDQDDLSVKPLGLKKDSVKVGKMVITPRVTKPKPKL